MCGNHADELLVARWVLALHPRYCHRHLPAYTGSVHVALIFGDGHHAIGEAGFVFRLGSVGEKRSVDQIQNPVAAGASGFMCLKWPNRSGIVPSHELG